MAIGMTYDEYWYGDPLMVRAYYKAEQTRRKMEDQHAWLQGLYVREALASTVGNMFLKDGAKPNEYPKEAYSITSDKEKQQKKEEKDAEKEAVWAMAWMSSFVQAGKNFGKNKSKEG